MKGVIDYFSILSLENNVEFVSTSHLNSNAQKPPVFDDPPEV